MIDQGIKVRAICDSHQCDTTDIDLAALAEKVGRAYCLAGRRCRCRRPGCRGWVRFFYLAGVYRRLFTADDVLRWMETDRPMRLASDRPG